uniref:F-box domain-containing protein n=1 Tax=Odontella aurita TaxID=265563 RepID=A0A7S4J1B3_9STRA
MAREDVRVAGCSARTEEDRGESCSTPNLENDQSTADYIGPSGQSACADASSSLKNGRSVTPDCPDLPEDTLCLVFRELSVLDLGSCHAVCSSWNRALKRKTGAMNLVWRRKMEECWWSLCSCDDSGSETHPGFRVLFQEKVCDRMRLRDDMKFGRFADSCDSRPWLMRGHSKRVQSVEQFGGRFCVTCSEDGEMRQWVLPLEGRRPEGNIVFERNDLVGTIESFVKIGSNAIAVSGNGGITAIVHFEVNEDKLKCHILQYIYSGRVSTMCSTGKDMLACAFSDGIIRVFPIYPSAVCTETPIETSIDEGMVLRGHKSCINSIVCLEGGSLLLSKSADQTARMWKSDTGECLWTAQFEGAIGGPSFIGTTQREVAVLCDTLEQCTIHICRLSDGVTNRILGMPCRVHAAEVHERSLLCGTEDGSIIEYSLDTGQQTLKLQGALESTVQSLWYLGRDSSIAIGQDGQMILLGLRTKVTHREIALKMRNPQLCFYDATHRTVLLASTGYLVRAIVFVH